MMEASERGRRVGGEGPERRERHRKLSRAVGDDLEQHIYRERCAHDWSSDSVPAFASGFG